jgi:hypothetical protein
MSVSKWLRRVVAALLISLGLAASSAVAQTCFRNGNGFTCDNGVAARRSGGYTNGNKTTYSNGLTCYQYGATVQCN